VSAVVGVEMSWVWSKVLVLTGQLVAPSSCEVVDICLLRAKFWQRQSCSVEVYEHRNSISQQQRARGCGQLVWYVSWWW